MATRPFTRAPRRRAKHLHNPQYRRDRRARPSMASLEAALALIPNLPRPLLCRLTDRMIERLDEMDGDVDLEPEEDVDGSHDDGCGMIIIHGRECWGSEHEQPFTTLPRYGADQTKGPINEVAAYAQHRAEALGLERSPTGGWRKKPT